MPSRPTVTAERWKSHAYGMGRGVTRHPKKLGTSLGTEPCRTPCKTVM